MFNSGGGSAASVLGIAGPRGLGGRSDEEIFSRFSGDAMRRLLPFLCPYRAPILAAVAAVILAVAAQAAIPNTLRMAIDAVTKPGGADLRSAILLLLGFALAAGVAGFVQDYVTARVAQSVVFDLRRAMFARLQDASLKFHDRAHVGRLISRLQGDTGALQDFLENSVSAVGDAILLAVIVVVLLATDWRLALLTLSVLPVLVGVRAIWLPRVMAIFHRARDMSSVVNSALAENVGGVRTVQGAQREARNAADFEVEARENFVAQLRASRAAQMMVPIVDLLTGLAMGIIVIAGEWTIADGRADLGVVVAFVFYAQRFFEPIRTISQQYTMLQRATAATHRILEVLDVPIDVRDKPDARPLRTDSPSIEFRGVTFSYRPGLPVLHDVSFTIKPGQTVGIVGPTGSGKSTIAALTHRFYDADEGAILIDGQDVRDLTQRSLGRTIAMVLQEPFLFSGTILDNIRYNSVSATRDQLVEAARRVRAHDFISALPEGYDTLLGQRGHTLSSGQRQLISFARALAADPKILILDEATASIDSATEQDIQAALKALLHGRTSLIIAHRLATIRDADKIIVFDHGRVVEQGSPDELARADGLYAGLLHSAFASFDDWRTPPS